MTMEASHNAQLNHSSPSIPSVMVGSIELRPFRPEDTSAVVELMAEQFSTCEPLTNSFFRKYPEAGKIGYQIYHKYWTLYLGDPEANLLSTVAYDHDAKEVVGCVVAQDPNNQPTEFKEKFNGPMNVLARLSSMEFDLLAKVDADKMELLMTPGKTAVSEGAAIKKRMLGKNLFPHLVAFNDALLLSKGYMYNYSCTLNYNSGKTLERDPRSEKLATMNTKEYVDGNDKPFELVEEKHKFASVWMRHLKGKVCRTPKARL